MKYHLHIPRLLCLLMAGVLMLAGCRNDISEIRAITDASNLPIQTSYKSEYVFSEKGKIKNKLIAAQLDQYQGDEGYIEASGGFAMIFFDSLEREEARLTAVHGRFSEKDKKMKAWEKVELINAKGEKLETEELIFVQDSSLIYTDKYVTITSANGSVLHGEGLTSNDSFTRYKIIKPHGDLFIDEKIDSTHVETK